MLDEPLDGRDCVIRRADDNRAPFDQPIDCQFFQRLVGTLLKEKRRTQRRAVIIANPLVRAGANLVQGLLAGIGKMDRNREPPIGPVGSAARGFSGSLENTPFLFQVCEPFG
jgi:hypothetical protein